MPNSFPCPSCGAPAEAVPNQTHMPCSFCGATLTIPVHLRWKKTSAPPLTPPKPSFDPFVRAREAVTPEMRLKNLEAAEKTTELLRKVQPAASKAYLAYVWWVLIQFVAPTCLLALGILCFLTMVASGIIFYFIQNAQ